MITTEKKKGGINDLAKVIQGRMGTVIDAKVKNVCDIGTVQTDGSLSLRMYPIPIPAGQYLVCRSLTLGAEDSELTETMGASGDAWHTHKVKLPKSMRQLQAGDNVFCCWVDSDVVVVDILGKQK